MVIRKKTIFGLLFTLLIALTIPFTSKIVQEGRKLISKAMVTPANILIDTQKVTGPVGNEWRAFAQGGEESTPYTLTPVVSEISQLQPKYIRIDHLYDFYDLVSRGEDGSLNFSFDSLDVLVRDILSTGALPFFSLSYMPPVISKDGNVTSIPASWEEWQLLVRKTIEHYSGRDGFNLTGVYYEVWNEPDLFGRFKAGEGDKDYLTLYSYAGRGAREAQNTNQFYFGGPAITGAYPSWISKFVSFALNNNLPIDFVSWHYYGSDVNKISSDIAAIDRVLNNFPGKKLQKIISEYGIDSENNPFYDNLVSASYTLASLKSINHQVTYAFSFSIKDGKSPDGTAFWGRWGLFTNEAVGKQAKPRFEALMTLSKLDGSELDLKGGGTFVNGFASKKDETIKAVFYNYDTSSSHYEKFPVTFSNLAKGNYQLTYYSLVSKTPVTENQIVSQGSLTKELILTPNDIALVELTRIASLFTFSQGRESDPENQSLELKENGDLPNFNLPENAENVSGNLNLWFKPYWSGSDENLDYQLFSLVGAGGQTLFARIKRVGFGNSLVFGLAIIDSEVTSVSLPIGDWPVNSWHNLIFSYGNGRLELTIDGEKASADLSLTLLPQNELQLKAVNGAIDDLVFTRSGTVVLQKNFDGNLD